MSFVSEEFAERTTVTAPRIATMIPKKSRFRRDEYQHRNIGGTVGLITNLPKPFTNQYWSEEAIRNEGKLKRCMFNTNIHR